MAARSCRNMYSWNMSADNVRINVMIISVNALINST